MPIDAAELKSILDAAWTHYPDGKGARKRDAEGALRVIAALQRIPHVIEAGIAPDATTEGAEDPAELAIARTVAAIDGGLEKIKADDLTAVETMLAGQATALEVLFNEYAKRAARTEYHAPIHMCLGFALRAQAQCRNTVQSLAKLKERRLARRVSPAVDSDPKPAE